MSKKVGFPVMSTMITGLLFILGLLLTTLGIVLAALGLSTLILGVLWFIGLLLFGWALLSFGLNPELEDYQRNIAFFFAVLLVTLLFGVGISISFGWM
ncbi:MAG: hypothetical protein WED05_11990 [Candidatus Atabeyarchaeum deiterrae]